MKKFVELLIRLEHKNLQKLRYLKYKTNSSLSELVREAVNDYLEKQDEKATSVSNNSHAND